MKVAGKTSMPGDLNVGNTLPLGAVEPRWTLGMAFASRMGESEDLARACHSSHDKEVDLGAYHSIELTLGHDALDYHQSSSFRSLFVPAEL